MTDLRLRLHLAARDIAKALGDARVRLRDLTLAIQKIFVLCDVVATAFFKDFGV